MDVSSTLSLLYKEHKQDIMTIYFYAIASGIIQLSLPLGIQTLIGFVQGVTMVVSIYILIAVILLGVLIVGLLQINQMKIIEKIQQKIFVYFAFDFAEKIPNLDMFEIDSYYLPEKANRFFDVQNIQKGSSKLLLDLPIALIQIIIGLFVLSIYHSIFIFFSILLIGLILIIFWTTSKQGLKTSIEESDNKYKVVAWFEEMGRVIKSFKYSQGTNLNLQITDNRLMDYLNARQRHFRVLQTQYKSFVFFKVTITALMLTLGVYLMVTQKINVGQFVAIEIIILVLINSFEKLIVSLESLYDLITGLKKIHSVLDLGNETSGNIEMKKQELNIQIENLSFGYDQNNTVFKKVNLNIPSNGITCVTGPENSGKSTLLKLLTGSYNSYSGSILFNGLDVSKYSLKSLRQNTGIMLNEQDIFCATLMQNITLGKSSITQDNILNLINEIGLEDFTSEMTDHFETILDPLGQKLPSSTVKKILLLRALIHDPILLILEEPWQGMDNLTKENIQNYLVKISKSKTVVISTDDSGFKSRCQNNIELQKSMS
ncbi:MAG TPA: ABC transporter ATP-binding protein [Saprospiraceae bacterium]|nr:ABC transporter ATP-binding protein [Saprospiraceae bacterium]